MYDQVDEHGRSKFTVTQIAAEFGVSRPTVYRYLDQPAVPHEGRVLAIVAAIAAIVVVIAGFIWAGPDGRQQSRRTH